MRRLAVLIGVAMLVGLGAAPSQADALSKREARAKSNAKVRTFLARSAWANRANVGRCTRKAKRRVVCFGSVRGKGRTCRVRITVRGKPARAKLRRRKCRTAQQGASPSKAIRLGAWLGSPGRQPLDPFNVTYPHGATATSTTQIASLEVESEPAPTPPGVLALYVDGILECAENVNEANPEATCPVDYDSLGSHRVTTIYTSGSESAADTMTHMVDPLGSSVAVTATYEPLSQASYLAEGCEAEVCELPEGFWENADMQLGTLHVTVSEVDPWGGLPKVNCPSGDLEPKAPDGCATLPAPLLSTYALPVTALADLIVAEDQVLVEGQPIDAEMKAPKNVTIAGTGISQESPTAIEAGERFFWARSGERAGYLSSQASEPIQFVPAATDVIRFR